jgi:purine-binding chemotaxis protein CheW
MIQKTTSKSKAKDQQRSAIDWDVIRRQIEAANQKLASGEEISPEALEKAWARRAVQIGHKIQEEHQGEMIQVAIISLDNELYGLDVQNIFDIRMLEHLTFVPRVPAWVLGVVNWRGHILSVIDLRRFLGLSTNNGPESKNKNTQRLIVLQAGEMEVGIQADEVFAIESIPVSKINNEDGGVRAIKAELVNGLYTNPQGIVMLLNLPTLLADPRLVIRDEIL